mmetsp:Transcript_107551/g.343071  ORF Transcript_107551/g.343071 Transcript_107551/m.343071 type:complete len:213 (+) Transcript_107551:112-750(+)
MIEALVVELVLASRTSLPGNGLRREVDHIVADGAILHAIEEESERLRPHQHRAGNAARLGACEDLPGLEHPIPDAWSGNARHLLGELGDGDSQREGLWQLDTQLRSQLVPLQQQDELFRPPGHRRLHVGKPVLLSLQHCLRRGALRLHDDRCETPCHQTLDQVPVSSPGQLFPERTDSCRHRPQRQQQHTGRRCEDRILEAANRRRLRGTSA